MRKPSGLCILVAPTHEVLTWCSGCQMMRTSLTRLRQLGIAASQVIGAHAPRDSQGRISGLVALEDINCALGATACAVAGLDGLQHLAGLPALEQLDMSGTTNCLPKGCRMPQLTALDISGAQVAREVLSGT